MTTTQRILKLIPKRAVEKLIPAIKETYVQRAKIDGNLSDVPVGTKPAKDGLAKLRDAYLNNPSPDALTALVEGSLPPDIIVLKLKELRRVFKTERKQNTAAQSMLCQTVAHLAEPYAVEWQERVEKIESKLADEVGVDTSGPVLHRRWPVLRKDSVTWPTVRPAAR